MNWEAIGAVGEILGAGAVVVTLVYLVVQLRQNTVAMRAQTRSAVTDQILEIQRTMLETPGLMEALAKTDSADTLNDQERRAARTNTIGWLRHWENVHFQYRVGTFEAPEYLAQRKVWRERLERSIYLREIWDQSRQFFSPELCGEIDTIVRDIEEERRSDA